MQDTDNMSHIKITGSCLISGTTLASLLSLRPETVGKCGVAHPRHIFQPLGIMQTVSDMKTSAPTADAAIAPALYAAVPEMSDGEFAADIFADLVALFGVDGQFVPDANVFTDVAHVVTVAEGVPAMAGTTDTAELDDLGPEVAYDMAELLLPMTLPSIEPEPEPVMVSPRTAPKPKVFLNRPAPAATSALSTALKRTFGHTDEYRKIKATLPQEEQRAFALRRRRETQRLFKRRKRLSQLLESEQNV
jgi:hypothetical protein